MPGLCRSVPAVAEEGRRAWRGRLRSNHSERIPDERGAAALRATEHAKGPHRVASRPLQASQHRISERHHSRRRLNCVPAAGTVECGCCAKKSAHGHSWSGVCPERGTVSSGRDRQVLLGVPIEGGEAAFSVAGASGLLHTRCSDLRSGRRPQPRPPLITPIVSRARCAPDAPRPARAATGSRRPAAASPASAGRG